MPDLKCYYHPHVFFKNLRAEGRVKYILETEFIGHERQVDVEDDTPVMGAERQIVRKHTQYGPFKTRRGAEKAIAPRKRFWRRKGFQRPPKKASAYDPNGNYMFRPYLSDLDEKMRRRVVAGGWHKHPDHVTFGIEERVVSKKPVFRTR